MATVLRNRVCKVCGSDKFTRDLSASSGDVSCMNCGSVQEENPIVSEVQFGESASGAAMVQGAMVGADQARANFNMRNAMESREQTLLNAKKKIKKIASVMRIPDYIVDSASGWFKLALVQNFVQGRRSQNVIAACLYVACRHEKTHHLLIDFSSRLQISVFSLGSTYLKLVRALQIQKLPIADPSLFIQHFADRLLFGDKTAKVCKDATKLAHRMSLDWIYEGRRPAGIAGACVLLAARMNKINRSHAEIVAVARVGEETIQKRLNEFKATPSGELKLSEFRDSENSRTSIPPSFKKNRAHEKETQKNLKRRVESLQRLKELALSNQLAKAIGIELTPLPENNEGSTAPSDETNETQGQTEDQPNEEDEEPQDDEEPEDGIEESSKLNEEQQEDLPSDSASASEKPPQSDKTEQARDTEGEEVVEKGTEEAADDETEDAEVEQTSEQAEATQQNGNEKESTAAQPSSDNGEEQEQAGEEGEEQMFVDSESSGDEYGYEELPDDPHDEDYQERSSKIRQATRMSKRTLSRLSSLGNLASAGLRLDSLSRHSAASRQTAKSRKLKAEKLKSAEKSKQVREDSLLKAVLDGGSFSESELETILDRVIKSNNTSLSLVTVIPSGKTADDAYYTLSEYLEQIDKNRPRNLVAGNPTTAALLTKVSDDVLLNVHDEDDEVRDILLLEEQREEKERIWIAINYDFLIAQEKKRLKMEADELTGNTSGQPKKRRRTKEQNVDSVISDPAVADAMKQIGEDGRVMTPADSAKQIFQKKAFSRKINYGSITELFNS